MKKEICSKCLLSSYHLDTQKPWKRIAREDFGKKFLIVYCKFTIKIVNFHTNSKFNYKKCFLDSGVQARTFGCFELEWCVYVFSRIKMSKSNGLGSNEGRTINWIWHLDSVWLLSSNISVTNYLLLSLFLPLNVTRLAIAGLPWLQGINWLAGYFQCQAIVT